MKWPRRLLDSELSEFEQQVLRAGQQEAPARGAERRVLARLAAGAAVTGAVAASKGATAATVAGQTTQGATYLKLGLGALLLAGAAAVTAVVGLAPEGSQGSAVDTAPPVVPPERTPERTDGPEKIAPEPHAGPASTESEPAPTSAPPVATRGAERPKEAENDSSLSAELRRIQSARELLHAGDAAGALRELAAYRAQFPKGSLHQEATVLRVESLTRAGQRSAAVKLARNFLESYPRSSYGRRLRSLLPELGDEGARER
jgi:TolA-binding protein